MPAKEVPREKRIGNFPVLVDAFKYWNTAGSLHFLSHFHSDHYNGLSSRWQVAPIYCSPPTCRLVHKRLGVAMKYLRPLELWKPHQLSVHHPWTRQTTRFTVTLIDANHCPGAVQFIFAMPDPENQDKHLYYLHTGDTRYSPSFSEYPQLKPLVGMWTAVYLDTTYCSPGYTFPEQGESIEYGVSVATQVQEEDKLSGRRTVMLVETYSLGKEKLLISMAKACNTKIVVTEAKMDFLKCLHMPTDEMSLFTTDKYGGMIHAVKWGTSGPMWPYFQPRWDNLLNCKQQLSADRIVCLIPTGWAYKKASTKKHNNSQQTGPSSLGRTYTNSDSTLTVHLVPYSEHSAYPELRQYLKFLKPKAIIPTVNPKDPKDAHKQLNYLKDLLPQVSIFEQAANGSKRKDSSNSQNMSNPTPVNTPVNEIQNPTIPVNTTDDVLTDRDVVLLQRTASCSTASTEVMEEWQEEMPEQFRHMREEITVDDDNDKPAIPSESQKSEGSGTVPIDDSILFDDLSESIQDLMAAVEGDDEPKRKRSKTNHDDQQEQPAATTTNANELQLIEMLGINQKLADLLLAEADNNIPKAIEIYFSTQSKPRTTSKQTASSSTTPTPPSSDINLYQYFESARNVDPVVHSTPQHHDFPPHPPQTYPSSPIRVQADTAGFSVEELLNPDSAYDKQLDSSVSTLPQLGSSGSTSSKHKHSKKSQKKTTKNSQEDKKAQSTLHKFFPGSGSDASSQPTTTTQTLATKKQRDQEKKKRKLEQTKREEQEFLSSIPPPLPKEVADQMNPTLTFTHDEPVDGPQRSYHTTTTSQQEIVVDLLDAPQPKKQKHASSPSSVSLSPTSPPVATPVSSEGSSPSQPVVSKDSKKMLQLHHEQQHPPTTPTTTTPQSNTCNTEHAVKSLWDFDPLTDACWNTGAVPYLHLSRCFTAMEYTTNTQKITDVLTNMFRSIIAISCGDLVAAVYICVRQLGPCYENHSLGMDAASVISAVAETTRREEKEVAAEAAKTGDLGTVAQSSRNSQTEFSVGLQSRNTIRDVWCTLQEMRSQDGEDALGKKKSLLQTLLVRSRESETKWIVRTVLQQMGVDWDIVLTALGKALVLTSPSAFNDSSREKSKGFPTVLSERAMQVSNALTKMVETAKRKELTEKMEECVCVLKTAYNRRPDIAHIIKVLVADKRAWKRLLDKCQAIVGTPVWPMLGRKTSSVREATTMAMKESNGFAVEMKYGGFRAQIHVDTSPQSVEPLRIFSTSLENNTEEWKAHIMATLTSWVQEPTVSFIIDTEIVAVNTETNQKVPLEMLSSVNNNNNNNNDNNSSSSGNSGISLCVYCFDIMYYNGEPLFNMELVNRRTVIYKAFKPSQYHFQFSETVDVTIADNGVVTVTNPMTSPPTINTMEQAEPSADKVVAVIKQQLRRAKEDACEGVVLKTLQGSTGSTYQCNHQQGGWFNLQLTDLVGEDSLVETLHVVPIATWKSNGRRAPFLVSLYDPTTHKYCAFTKIMCGLTEKQHVDFTNFYRDKRLDSKAQNYCVNSYLRPDFWFQPSEVWEIQASEITLSGLYSAAHGYVAEDKGLNVKQPWFLRKWPEKATTQSTSPQQLVQLYNNQQNKVAARHEMK